MNYKLFVKNFWHITGVAKIFFLQTLCMGILSYAFGLMAVVVGVRGCPPRYETMGAFYWIILVTGVISFLVAIYPILVPTVWLHEISKDLTRSEIDYRFPFFSTHPHYLAIDALFTLPALLLFWNGISDNMCEFNFEWGAGLSAMIIAISFPALRAFSWYGLRRQIYAMQLPNVWPAIIWWYILTLPIILFFSYTYFRSEILVRRNIPIVDAQTFAGGLDAHPEFLDQIVRVRGKMKQGIAKCGLFGQKERTDFPYGTVVVYMGPEGGEIMIQAQKPAAVLDLESESMRGGTIEAFGRLSRLPNPEKKRLCGIDNLPSKLPEGGRYLLEVEPIR